MKYSANELKDLVLAIAAKLGIAVSLILLTQNDDETLTVQIGDSSFTGTMEQIWNWLDALKKTKDLKLKK